MSCDEAYHRVFLGLLLRWGLAPSYVRYVISPAELHLFERHLILLLQLMMWKSVQVRLIIRIMKLYYLKNCSVTFVWIPSHVGIKGNEIDDSLFKAAKSHSTVDIIKYRELRDAYNDICKYIAARWQKDYNSQISGLHYKTLEPVANNRIKVLNKYKRSKERLITRLRLGHCRLNHYMFKIGQHPAGECEHYHTIGNNKTLFIWM